MGANYAEWLRRHGITDGAGPETLRVVQPVEIVRDVSGVVSPEVGVLANSSSLPAAVVGEHGGFEFECRAASEVELTISSPVACHAFWYLNTSQLALNNRAVSNFTSTSEHPRSKVQRGTTATPGLGGFGNVYLAANTPWTFEFYARYGFWYYAFTDQANTAPLFSVRWREYQYPRDRDFDNVNFPLQNP